MALSRINTNQIVDGAVATADIADGLITTAKLADGAVTTAKITDGNISTAKLADDAVTTAKVNPSQTDITQVGTLTSFASTGIDDNADANAITIDSSERLHVGTESLTSKLNVVGDGNTKGLSIKSGGATGVNPFQVTWSAGSEGAMLKVDDNGNTHIGIGNLVIGTSGKGIDFSAESGDASGMTSEILDDYETGTFSPSFIGTSGSAGSHSIIGKEGKYVKIGRQVFVHIRLVIANGGMGSYSGTNRLTGFPYASNADNPTALTIGADALNATENAFVIINGQNYGVHWDRFTNSSFNYTSFTSGYNMIISGTYYSTA